MSRARALRLGSPMRGHVWPADVTTATHHYEKAHVHLKRDGTRALIVDTRGTVHREEDATSAVLVDVKGKHQLHVYEITLDTGETWTATKLATCGCGGTKVHAL